MVPQGSIMIQSQHIDTFLGSSLFISYNKRFSYRQPSDRRESQWHSSSCSALRVPPCPPISLSSDRSQWAQILQRLASKLWGEGVPSLSYVIQKNGALVTLFRQHHFKGEDWNNSRMSEWAAWKSVIIDNKTQGNTRHPREGTRGRTVVRGHVSSCPAPLDTWVQTTLKIQLETSSFFWEFWE